MGKSNSTANAAVWIAGWHNEAEIDVRLTRCRYVGQHGACRAESGRRRNPLAGHVMLVDAKLNLAGQLFLQEPGSHEARGTGGVPKPAASRRYPQDELDHPLVPITKPNLADDVGTACLDNDEGWTMEAGHVLPARQPIGD
jgi:hypothetical protein